MAQEELFRLHVAPARRLFAVAALMLLALVLLLLAFSQGFSLFYRIFLIAFGVTVLLTARRMVRVTRNAIILREDGIFLTDGEVIAEMDHITKVETGPFAMKPTGGVGLKLDRKYPATYMPGLYWRFGKRIGIGGVTQRGAGKAMGDALAAFLARER